MSATTGTRLGSKRSAYESATPVADRSASSDWILREIIGAHALFKHHPHARNPKPESGHSANFEMRPQSDGTRVGAGVRERGHGL